MIKYMAALIVVEDVTVARRFYEQVLGQTVGEDFGENIGFVAGFAIHHKSHYQGLIGAGHPIANRPNDAELYFETDDFDGLCARLEQERVEFLHGVVEQPWRQRAMRFYDPDGHIIEVGEPMDVVVRRLHSQGMTAEGIQQATFMPVEYIEQMLAA